MSEAPGRDDVTAILDALSPIAASFATRELSEHMLTEHLTRVNATLPLESIPLICALLESPDLSSPPHFSYYLSLVLLKFASVRGIAQCHLATIACTVGYLLLKLNRPDAASSYFEFGASCAEQDNAAIFRLRSGLGVAAMGQSRCEDAIRYFADCIDIAPGAVAISGVLNNIAMTQTMLGRLDEARGTFERALAGLPEEESHTVGYQETLRDLQGSLAHLLIRMGNFQEARRHAKFAVEASRKLKDKRAACRDLMELFNADFALADYAEAAGSAQEALTISTDLGDIDSMRRSHEALAATLERTARTPDAIQSLEAARYLAYVKFNKDDEQRLLIRLADSYARTICMP